MRSVKSLIAAGAASLLSSAAFAADMPMIAPPPPMYAPPPVVEDFGGWYLRGDIGFSNQHVSRLNNVLDAGNTTSVQNLGFNTAGIFGLGVGYRVNNWFRADVTGEYRGNSQFFGTDAITYPGGVGTDTYHATKSEWVVLANAYVDLGTWWCMTPFIGAGVGTARVGISNFTDQGIANNGGGALPGLAFGDNTAKWNFAWALHAGVAYKVTPNFTVELAYRYLDMGDGLTGDLRTFDGTNNIVNPTTFKGITSHDLKIGVRWNLDTPQTYAPPLIRKG
jgi:opacity protein-like surface antigen